MKRRGIRSGARVMDFRWYYKTFNYLPYNWWEFHATTFRFAAWISRTFNLILIVRDDSLDSEDVVI
jgi:hypothetical protein